MSKACNLCPLATSEQIAGAGPAKPKLIIIGNYPTRDDERTLKPFSLNSKRDNPNVILYRMLASMKIAPEEVYMAYALRCNPFKHGTDAKAPQISVCSSNHLLPALSKVECPVILTMGEAAMLSLIPEAKGGMSHHRGKWHEITIGEHRRSVRVTFPLAQVERLSLWRLSEDSRGNLVRTQRWNPIGTCGWFFQQDMRAVHEKLTST